jgi:hypothetical protein
LISLASRFLQCVHEDLFPLSAALQLHLSSCNANPSGVIEFYSRLS